MDVVADYNTWAEAAFDEPVPVPPRAVPQIAAMLYQSRVQEHFSETDLEFPDFENWMYE